MTTSFYKSQQLLGDKDVRQTAVAIPYYKNMNLGIYTVLAMRNACPGAEQQNSSKDHVFGTFGIRDSRTTPKKYISLVKTSSDSAHSDPECM
jgi:hypothetical protein